jgi:hypothetical protein
MQLVAPGFLAKDNGTMPEEIQLRWLIQLLIVAALLSIPLNRYQGGSWPNYP